MATATTTTRYFHTDHLGSIAVITNEAGTVVERLSYDAWGKRRFPNGADDTAGAIESLSTRGFTGHEQLDTVGLVHMNGRVYDPMIGRMISPDPIVPDALNAQAWNRYSYVGNDPLTFTDPSGHSWFSDIFRGISNFFKSIVNAVKTVLNLVVRFVVQAVVTTLLAFTGPLAPFIAAAVAAAVVTGMNGGKLGDMLKSAAVAGATAFAFSVVGGATNVAQGKEFSLFNHDPVKFGTPEYAFNVAGHAAVGCASSAASGGSCGSGALAGAVGAASGPLVNVAFPNQKTDAGDYFGGLATTSALGGLASVAGGGKFENGAVTAAFGYMYNLNAKPTTPEGRAQAFQDGLTVMRWTAEAGLFVFGGFAIDAIRAAYWGAKAGSYSFSATVAAQAVTRPYQNSTLLIDEIIANGAVVPDSVVSGWVRYTAPGTMWNARWGAEAAASRGTYELVIDPKTKTIYHFLFNGAK